MAVQNLISATHLRQYLSQEITKRLQARGVQDIGHCAWLNEHEPSPEFLGHAMWQVEPPLGLGPVQVNNCPSKQQEVLEVSSSDFCGLMRFARMSLGLTLWHLEPAEEAFIPEHEEFWLHYVNAMILMGAASDRLRDFFVTAHFNQTTDAYNKTKGRWNGYKYHWYQTPFVHARTSCDPSIADLLEKLASLSEQIYQHREDRNRVVHEIATRTAQTTRELISRQRLQFDQQQLSEGGASAASYQEFAENVEKARQAHRSEHHAAADQLVSWYDVLLHASSYAFESENRIRKRDRQA